MAYWFNTATNSVETDETRGQDIDVLGPYATEAEARQALEHARENTEKWDEEDRAWNEDGTSSAWSDDDLED